MSPQRLRQAAEVRCRPARRNRRLALTPLVDVVFILLIFFILESRFLRDSAIDWFLPAGQGQPAAAPLTVLLFDERWLWIGDERVAVPAAGEWAALCGRAGRADAAVLKPGPMVRLQHLVDLSGGLRGCGISRVAVQPLEI